MLAQATIDGIRRATEEFWAAEVRSEDFATRLVAREFGQRVAQDVEDRTVALLSEHFPTCAPRRATRDMGDTWLTENGYAHPINVKVGDAARQGRPNMVSLKRVFEALARREIDSYYVLQIKIDRERLTARVVLCDLLDHLEFVRFDAGPGQLMLAEKEFSAAIAAGHQPERVPVTDKLTRLLALHADALERLAANRARRHEDLRALAANYTSAEQLALL